MRSILMTLAIAILTTLPALAQPAKPADWPQFRGPNRDGISTETGLLKTWPAGGPQVLWKAPLGSGFSASTIVDGRLFTQFGQGKDEFAAAIDTATGKELWRVRTDTERKDQFGDGPRSTPTVDGDRLFVVSALGKLYALKPASGETLWSVDLVKEYGARVPQWGVSASPLIDGQRLLFNAGGRSDYAVVALDKTTGKLLWHTGTDIPGYSAPILVEIGGVRQAVFFSGTEVLGIAPADGKVLWQKEWRTSYDVNAATPIFLPPDQLFIASGYDTGAAVFRLAVADGKMSAKEVWRSRDMKNQFSSSVHLGGTIYGFNNKNLQAIDAATGAVLWRKSGLGHGSLLAADGHLIVLGDSGQLVLAEANPAAYVEKAAAQPLNGKHWTVPTLYGGRLYLRNESELVCLKIAG